jgi:hypothetical protein
MGRLTQEIVETQREFASLLSELNLENAEITRMWSRSSLQTGNLPTYLNGEASEPRPDLRQGHQCGEYGLTT